MTQPNNKRRSTKRSLNPKPDQNANEEQDVILPDDHPAVSSWYDDPRNEEQRTGESNRSIATRFKTGKSGNPRGRPRNVQPLPGTLMSLIGKTLLEDIADALRTPVGELGVNHQATAAHTLARKIVADAIKTEGRSRALIISYFVEPQRGSDRYMERDAGAREADNMSQMVKALTDPTMTEARLDGILKRLTHEAEHARFEIEKPSDELPPLPKPRRLRSRRRS